MKEDKYFNVTVDDENDEKSKQRLCQVSDGSSKQGISDFSKLICERKQDVLYCVLLI